MLPAIAGIDHSLTIANDLEAAAALYRRLGFTLTPRGRHIGWGTANYCIMFAIDYLELLGIVAPDQFVNGLDQQLASRGAGLSGLAFATPDAAEAFERLDVAGLAARNASLSRLIERDGGDEELRFSLTYADPDATPGLNSFLCQHHSADRMREPGWLEHPNGAVGIEGVTVIADEPAALAAVYQRFLQALGQPLDRLWRGQGRLDLPIGVDQALRFLSPERAARRYPGVPIGLLSRAGPLVLTLRTASLAVTERFCIDQGLPLLRVPGDRLVLDPRLTDGTIIEFAA